MNAYFYLASIIVFSSIPGRSDNEFYKGRFEGRQVVHISKRRMEKPNAPCQMHGETQCPGLADGGNYKIDYPKKIVVAASDAI